MNNKDDILSFSGTNIGDLIYFVGYPNYLYVNLGGLRCLNLLTHAEHFNISSTYKVIIVPYSQSRMIEYLEI